MLAGIGMKVRDFRIDAASPPMFPPTVIRLALRPHYAARTTLRSLKPLHLACRLQLTRSLLAIRVSSTSAHDTNRTHTPPPPVPSPPPTWVDRLPQKARPYFYLTRIDKPIGTLLLFYPCAWSITMASFALQVPVTTPLKYISLFGLGALVMRGAGCTINDLWDRNLDKAVGELCYPACLCEQNLRMVWCRPDTRAPARERRHYSNAGNCVSWGATLGWVGCSYPAELVQVCGVQDFVLLFHIDSFLASY